MTLAERSEMFGDGPYTSLMSELYSDTQRLFGFSKAQAMRTAKAYGCDMGNCSFEQKAQFGKLSKDGRLNIRVVNNVKKVKETFSMRIAKACVTVQDAIDIGVLIPQSGLTFNEAILEWVNKGATPVATAEVAATESATA